MGPRKGHATGGASSRNMEYSNASPVIYEQRDAREFLLWQKAAKGKLIEIKYAFRLCISHAHNISYINNKSYIRLAFHKSATQIFLKRIRYPEM